jgi:predicted ATPase
MSGFKILALVPLKGCDVKFTKNLKIGKIYKFYQDYNISLNRNKTLVEKVIPPKHSQVPNFYSTKSELEISISAIVGENGSGKSSLIELFYYMVYFVGTRSKKKNKPLEYLIDKPEKNIRQELAIIESEINECSTFSSPERKSEFLARIVHKYGIDINEKNEKKSIDQFILEKLQEKKNRIEKRNNAATDIENKIQSNLNVALVFESNFIYCLRINEGDFSVFQFTKSGKLIPDKINDFNLESFFYSISVNYSHHSLNSISLGEWINTLFHKNDGYQTPLVINPMRNNGNFDVNHESRLLKERLIGNVTFNLFKDSSYKLIGKYRFKNFIFSPKLNTGEETVSFSVDKFDSEFFTKNPIGQILHCKGIDNLNEDQINWRAISYLDKKVFRLPEQYPFFFKEEITKSNCKPLIHFVNTNYTHITKKIYQTIFFLSSYNKSDNLKALWKPNDFGEIILSRNNMMSWLKSFKKEFKDLKKRGDQLSPYSFSIFALPGFMNVDFEITDTEKRKTFKLSELSSGEQQIILNLSSISYHLHNIQSIHDEDEKRFKYENINVFLDEIELYYHPNSQRKMIKEIIDSIKEVPLFDKGIKAVNILFSTHSPFILSDIPSSNILHLDNGLPIERNEQTFGSNINDLLADSFFMEAVIGQFAEEKISSIIENIKQKKKSIEDDAIINLIGDSFLKTGIEQFKKDSYDKN